MTLAITVNIVLVEEPPVDPPPPPPPPPPSSLRSVGLNFFFNSDWDVGYIFADVIKQGRYWSVPGGWPAAVAVDVNGWPISDADIILIAKDAGTYDASGVYKLSFESSTPSVTITAPSQAPTGSVTISNQVYANGVVTADVTLSATATRLTLGFRNTGDGVRNVRLLRPGHTAQDVFALDMLEAIEPFSTLRPMQMVAEPVSLITSWSQRRKPGWPQQTTDENAGIGVAYEWLVLLANTAQKDLWLCLPRNADDDYIAKVAQLVRYGSDGTNPYTSTQANPVFPPLAPGLRVWFERSNELWNYSLNAERVAAVASVNSGDPLHLRFDDTANEWYWAHRWHVAQSVRLSMRVREVFGDAAMGPRVKVVLATQINYTDVYVQQLSYLTAVWGPANTYDNPLRAQNHYFYALSGAPYPHFTDQSDALSVNDVFTLLNDNVHGLQNVLTQIDSLKSAADAVGLAIVAYEGGQSVFSYGGRSHAAKLAAQTDPRMKVLTKALLEKWYSVTDEPFVYFTAGSAGDYFRLGNGWHDTNTPKWQALREAAQGI